MIAGKPTRRSFLQRSLWTSAAAGAALNRLTAAGYARTIGANDRINIGLIGCGGRGRYILANMVKPLNAHVALVACCDIWKPRLADYLGEAEKLFGARPASYDDHRRVLDDASIDAVIIATPDHQHAAQAIEAVQAQKHVYVEKPIAAVARDLPVLNRCCEVVKASKLAVQNGTQGVSCPAARALRQFIADRKLGRLFRVESTESWVRPFWVGYQCPASESDTNWKAFLYNREYRPFDANQHGKWMGYHDFSSGPIGGWMSHFINLVHFVTGSEAPVAATGFGGRYALNDDPRCDAPNEVAVILEYAEGFHTQFTTHFGSSIDDETTRFMFEKGVLRSRFGHFIGNPTYSSEGVNDEIPETKLLETDPPNPAPAHVANWFECIREGKQPNANMDFGYKHGIAVLMGDLACSLGRKVVFDKASREIRPA